MIAFITFKSSLVPLFEGLWSSNSWEFELSGFRRNRTDDLGIVSPSLWPTEPRLHVREYLEKREKQEQPEQEEQQEQREVSSGFMPVLVVTLSHPMLYFSKRQRNVIVRCDLSALGSYADYLLGWIPVYIVAGALGFVCIHIYIHTYHVSQHSPPSKYILIYIRIYIDIYKYREGNVYIYTYVYTCTYIYIYTYIHIFIYIFIYIHTYHVSQHSPPSIQPQSILVCLSCHWKVLVPSSPDPSLSHVQPGLLNAHLHSKSSTCCWSSHSARGVSTCSLIGACLNSSPTAPERAQRSAPCAACSLGRLSHYVLPGQHVVKARILQGLSEPVPTSAPALARRKELAFSKGCLYPLPDQHLLQRDLLARQQSQ